MGSYHFYLSHHEICGFLQIFQKHFQTSSIGDGDVVEKVGKRLQLLGFMSVILGKAKAIKQSKKKKKCPIVVIFPSINYFKYQ